MTSWQGTLLIGGDFNLVRFTSDKSNGQINHRWADLLNNWVSKWGLIELSAANKKFTWTNNKDDRILGKIDRVFVSTSWEAAFPLAVKALDCPAITTHYFLTLVRIPILVRRGLDSRNGGSRKNPLGE
jgi:hypothetical protein